jgi:predicted metal-binding protein
MKVVIVGCGAYMSSGYGCPGEWRCLKAAAEGEGEFTEKTEVVGFVRCECPGRSTAPNVGLSVKQSGIKPDAVYLSTCMAKAKPDCPYAGADEMAQFIENKTGIPVKLGTHDYH